MTCVVDAAEKESGERFQNQLTENAERLELKETAKRNSGRNGAIPCNWSFPGEKPFSGLLKNSSEIWNVTEKLGEPLSLFVHSQTLPTVFSCYNLLGLIVIEMSIFVRNACRTNSSPRFWSFH